MNESENKQIIILTDRSDLVIDNVENIISFDEGYVVLATKAGRVNVEGKELKVDSLTKDGGKIHIIGNITGVFYSSDAGKQGAFSRLFK